MRKIGLFLATEPQEGGAFQYGQMVLDAVCSLRNHDFDVLVACTSEKWNDYLSRYEVRTLIVRKDWWTRNFDRPRFINLPVSLVRAVSPHLHSLTKTLLREQCELWIFPHQDVWSYQIPVPSLVSVHDLMHRYERRFPEVSSKGEYRMREWKYRNICKWARGILVDSDVGKRHVEESYGCSPSRISVLPYIAPASTSSNHSIPGFDSRYDLPEKFIFYPAQFWHHKNHTGLIEAISRLKTSIPDLKCVFVGSQKNGYVQIVDLVRKEGLEKDILFLGYVADEDMPEFYRRARALVMPTFFGPTNIPPLEAFANGCPVAISSVYGIPEQVGNAALLFDPDSVDDIARAVKLLWTDDRLCEDLRRKGRERTNQWGQEQFNERMRVIIERLISVHSY